MKEAINFQGFFLQDNQRLSCLQMFLNNSLKLKRVVS